MKWSVVSVVLLGSVVGGCAMYGASYAPRQVVSFGEKYAPGTIVVSTSQRRLYLIKGNGQAVSYTIGVGEQGYSWSGVSTVSAKREWPDWTPTDAMRKRKPQLPVHMVGGEANPMGARALYLGNSMYRIHGTNDPGSIGEARSAGCIRMANDDVIDLYNQTRLGTTVIVRR